MKDHRRYETLIFDCDGVILDSNGLKTEAFRKAALPFGEEIAGRFVDYHQRLGGVSRYRKFRHLLEEIVGEPATDEAVDWLLRSYSSIVRRGLLDCRVNPALEGLRRQDPESRWMVASGGDQAELRQVFAERGIDTIFTGGIFGSPDPKEEILVREIGAGNIRPPALFLGDSLYDLQAAEVAGLDFLFVEEWSETPDWREAQERLGFESVARLGDLIR